MTWFETWFDTPYYHILYKDRDFAEAENFITLLINNLQICKSSKIIDLACGKGRHSVFLNKMGYDVLGLDLSKESILHNQKFENRTLQFKVHDMREEILGEISTEKAHAVFNLFTSFGYFDKTEDDQKVFQSISNILEKDGFFVLDFLNENYVKKTIVPEYVVTKGGLDFHINKRIEGSKIIKDIRFKDQRVNHHYFESVKLHTQEQIASYGEKFGFRKVKTFGNYQLSDFDLESSPRCITIFQKI